MQNEMQKDKILHWTLTQDWEIQTHLKTGVKNILPANSVIFGMVNVLFNDEWVTEATKYTTNK